MAESVHLTLTGSRQGLIAGDSTVTSLSRANTIECVRFEQASERGFDRATRRVTGRRFHGPIRVRKRVDRSSPPLRSALVHNETMTAVFRFYRPDPSGSGTTQQYFTITGAEGAITAVRLRTPDGLDPVLALRPDEEEVELVFGVLTWRYEDDGVEFEDHWDAQV
jgi:type VI secretion system secreted protein Hcp